MRLCILQHAFYEAAQMCVQFAFVGVHFKFMYSRVDQKMAFERSNHLQGYLSIPQVSMIV